MKELQFLSGQKLLKRDLDWSQLSKEEAIKERLLAGFTEGVVVDSGLDSLGKVPFVIGGIGTTVSSAGLSSVSISKGEAYDAGGERIYINDSLTYNINNYNTKSPNGKPIGDSVILTPSVPLPYTIYPFKLRIDYTVPTLFDPAKYANSSYFISVTSAPAGWTILLNQLRRVVGQVSDGATYIDFILDERWDAVGINDPAGTVVNTGSFLLYQSNEVWTPQSSGSQNITFTGAITGGHTYNVYVRYIKAVDLTYKTVHSITSEVLYPKKIDGYKIIIAETIPTDSVGYIQLGSITLGTEVAPGPYSVQSISNSGRPIFDLKYYPPAQNIKDHQIESHTKGLVVANESTISYASNGSLASYITGAAVSIKNLLLADFLYIDGERLTSTIIGSWTTTNTVPFIAADSVGIYYIYLKYTIADGSISAPLKQITTAPVDDTTYVYYLICSVYWDGSALYRFQGAALTDDDTTDLRTYNTTYYKNLQVSTRFSSSRKVFDLNDRILWTNTGKIGVGKATASADKDFPAANLDVLETFAVTTKANDYIATRSGSTSPKTITKSSGTAFSLADVGRVFVWETGLVDKISVYVGPTIVEITSTNVTDYALATRGTTYNTTLWTDANGNTGFGIASPIRQTQIFGDGQLTPNLTDTGATGATLLISDRSTAGGAGGAVALSALNSSGTYVPQAAIKSLLTNGTTNGVSDLTFSVRNGITDTNLTEAMRIVNNGNVRLLNDLFVNRHLYAHFELQHQETSGSNITVTLAAPDTGYAIIGGALDVTCDGTRSGSLAIYNGASLISYAEVTGAAGSAAHKLTATCFSVIPCSASDNLSIQSTTPGGAPINWVNASILWIGRT